MVVIGDASLWEDTFPDYLVPDILELVVSVWEIFPKPGSDDHEVPITRRFRATMRQHKNARRLPITIDREIPEDDLQTGEELGRIDLRFTHGYREDVYFAFECKRLNVVLNGRRRALAAEYVVQGMMRFITSQYATNLTQGGIIGYIMNGDTTTAVRAVSSRVGRQCQELRISSPSSLCKSSLLPSNKQIKETRHDLENRKFIIHHIFLPI